VNIVLGDTGSRDVVLYELRNGKMEKVGTSQRPDKRNFLIVCTFGDWSGFRTLANCEKQISELEELARDNQRPDGYYRIVERF